MRPASSSGLSYDDAACKDIARMFYLPSVYRKDLLAKWPQAVHVEGKPFSFLPYFEAALASKTLTQTPSKVTQSPAKVAQAPNTLPAIKSFKFQGIDLTRWAATKAKTFKIEQDLVA